MIDGLQHHYMREGLQLDLIIDESHKLTNITHQDCQFLVQLFNEPSIDKLFKPHIYKNEKWVMQQIQLSLNYSCDLNPCGWFMIREGEKRIGTVFMLPTNTPGECSIGFAVLPELWGHGICTSVMNKIINEWASEVRSFGKGEIHDDRIPDIQTAFRCFKGLPLSTLAAIYSPINARSQAVLIRSGFTTTTCLNSDLPFDLRNSRYNITDGRKFSFLMAKFFSEGRSKDVPYQLINSDGTLKTIIFKSDYNEFRLSVSRSVLSINELAGGR